MKKVLLWIPSIPYLLSFGFVLVVFHVLQVIALKISYGAHKKVVDGMIFWINQCHLWLLSPIKYENRAGDLPTDKPMIIISNHQGMFDIPAIGRVLKKHHPKYISKQSLAFGIPSVSYNIRNGGSIYIDRKKPAEAIEKIKAFSQYLNKNNRAGLLFPEGTRSRDGSMKPFKRGGFQQMLTEMPDATIVPVAMRNFWRMEQYKLRPMPFRVNLKCTVLPAVSREGKSQEELMAEVEAVIKAELGLL